VYWKSEENDCLEYWKMLILEEIREFDAAAEEDLEALKKIVSDES